MNESQQMFLLPQPHEVIACLKRACTLLNTPVHDILRVAPIQEQWAKEDYEDHKEWGLLTLHEFMIRLQECGEEDEYPDVMKWELNGFNPFRVLMPLYEHLARG